MPTAPMLRVALLEDQPLFREMLQHLLRSVPGFQVSAAASVQEALATWDPEAFDLGLLDVELPDGSGLSVGRELQRRNPALRVVLLSAMDRVQILLELSDEERERWSYLSKTSSTSAPSLVRALRAAAAGRCVIDERTVSRREARAGSRLASLSPRQREVLALLAEGLTNQAIADRLGLARNSANNHVNALYTALGLVDPEHNPRVSAVRMFLEDSV